MSEDSSANGYRTEHDSLGEVPVPSGALYGAQTARAITNFPISRMRLQPRFIRALAMIKSSAAKVNGELGHIDSGKGARIRARADEVADGKYGDQFVVDVFQTGSGTSTNMNVNEVIGHLAGAHPNDDVNRGKSSNDAIPSAIHIAAADAVMRGPAARDGSSRCCVGRESDASSTTSLKSAARICRMRCPSAWGRNSAVMQGRWSCAIARIEAAMAGIYELPLGGTAVGTGLNAPAGFARR